MTAQNSAVRTYDQRVGPVESLQTGCELADLVSGVLARIIGIGFESANIAILNREHRLRRQVFIHVFSPPG